MFLLRKRLSLLISCILLYTSGFYFYDYKCGVNSMNSILNTYNVYYKNRISNTYVIVNNDLLLKLMKYNWHVVSIRKLDKNKIIIYLNPTCRETIMIGNNNTKNNYNLVSIMN